METRCRMDDITVWQGDCRELMGRIPDGTVDSIVTSPPFWAMRDYGANGQLGLEERPELYVEAIATAFNGMKRVLSSAGVLMLNLGDCFFGGAGSSSSRRKDAASVVRPKIHKECQRCGAPFEGTPKRRFCSAYCGGIDNSPRSTRPPYFLKPKDLVGLPWRCAFALQAGGWFLRGGIVWWKPNASPDSPTKDRPLVTHEFVFLFSKGVRYYFDDPGQGSVWEIRTRRTAAGHPAAMPLELAIRCVCASCPPGGLVLDPFAGSGSTLVAAQKSGRRAIGIELNPAYIPDIDRRVKAAETPLFQGFGVDN